MKRISIIIITLFLIAFAVRTEAHEYPYVVEVHEDDEMHLPDSSFYKIARSVVFPVNKFKIAENSEFYHELVEEIIPDMNKKGYRLESIQMRGAASPEGPLGWNTFLGEHRRKALFDLIDRNMEIPSCDDCLKTKDVPEDYYYLLYMMKEAKDPEYARVHDLVITYIEFDIEKLKQRLMSLDEGKLWKRMLKEYFPELRAARVVLFFRPVRMEFEANLGNQPALIDNSNFKLPSTAYNGPEVIFPDYTQLIKLPRREILSVKTNLLFDGMYMPFGYNRYCPIPNVAIEYYPLHGHFTYGASFDCPWWQDYWAHKYFQVRNYQLETRYYFRSGDIRKNPPGEGAAFRGTYLQAYGHAGLYSICFDELHGYEGEGIGGGLGIGYMLPLTEEGHWRLDFGAQFGYFWTKYDPYRWECPVDPTEQDHLYYYDTMLGPSLFKRRQHRFTWLGPTRVGITLTYDLLYRKNHKRGVSFRDWEWQKGGAR